MHEIRVTVPEGRAKDVAEIAHQVGITQVSVYPVFMYGPNTRCETISAQTSTPKAKKFADLVLAASWFEPGPCTLSSRQLRALITGEDAYSVTRPMLEPPINVFEQLWQANHITISYWARAFSGAILLAFGMAKDDPITIVIAALFLPFLSQSLATSFGAWAGDIGLVRQGIKALIVSTACSVAAGVIMALLLGGPMKFAGYWGPLASFAVSAVIGVTSGIITADDAGRGFLIGVAASIQYGIFPVWFGYSLVSGLPDSHTVLVRIGTFFVNIVTITVFGLLGYTLLDIKRRDVQCGFMRVRSKQQPKSSPSERVIRVG
jgi:hypothetical protein